MSDLKSPQETLSALGAGISGTVNEVLQDARPAFNRMADRVTESMHELASEGRDAAYEAERQLEGKVRHIRVSAEHYIQHAPFKSILIAAGTGAVTALAVSWLMRSRSH